MMIEIPGVLTPDQIRHCRQQLESAPWSDGKLTAGHSAISAKANLQLPVGSATAVELGNLVVDAIGQHPLFVAATLPLKVLPPMFNCYRGGGTYGNHIDNAIRQLPGSPHRVRTDISCTLFFSDPDEYDGGELTVEDTYGTRGVKAVQKPTNQNQNERALCGVFLGAKFYPQRYPAQPVAGTRYRHPAPDRAASRGTRTRAIDRRLSQPPARMGGHLSAAATAPDPDSRRCGRGERLRSARA